MKQVVFYLVIFLAIVGILIRFGPGLVVKILGIEPRAGIRVDASIPSEVYLNNKLVGTTPFQDENLTVGDYTVELKSTSSANLSWSGSASLYEGALTVVNRELVDPKNASSGETIMLKKGSGASILSEPSGATVVVDGSEKGATPLSISDLSEGEHQFIISKDGFLKRSIRANVVKDYTLVLQVDLAASDQTVVQTPVSSASPSPTASAQPKTITLEVLDTPNGFLRVRSASNTSSAEVTRVKTGDRLTALEKLHSWYKVKLASGEEGYVSASYVQEINP